MAITSLPVTMTQVALSANDSIDIFSTRIAGESSAGGNIITAVTKYPPGMVERRALPGRGGRG